MKVHEDNADWIANVLVAMADDLRAEGGLSFGRVMRAVKGRADAEMAYRLVTVVADVVGCTVEVEGER